jgi:hypothetical protein
MSKAPDRTEQSRDDMNQAIGPEVSIPGPYPTGEAPTSAETANTPSQPPAHTQVSQDVGSLGDLTKEQSTSTVAEESGGLGSPLYEDEKRQDDIRLIRG